MENPKCPRCGEVVKLIQNPPHDYEIVIHCGCAEPFKTGQRFPGQALLAWMGRNAD